MNLKKNLTPLNELDLISPTQLQSLRQFCITTLEEFVGIVEADPEGARGILNIGESDFKELSEKALALLDPEIRDSFKKKEVKKYPLGSLGRKRDRDP